MEVLERFGADLGSLLNAVRHGDGKHLHEVFTRAKRLRDRYAEESGARDGRMHGIAAPESPE